jgi:hypothetical protein
MNGVAGTLADVTLVAEHDGHRVTQTTSTAADGAKTTVSKAYSGDGTLVYAITSQSNAAGTSVVTRYDDDGDQIVDRVQTIVTTQVAGERIETERIEALANLRGNDVTNDNGLTLREAA